MLSLAKRLHIFLFIISIAISFLFFFGIFTKPALAYTSCTGIYWCDCNYDRWNTVLNNGSCIKTGTNPVNYNYPACNNSRVNAICGKTPTPTPTSNYTCKYTCTSSALCNAEGTQVSGTCTSGVCCNFGGPVLPTVTPVPTIPPVNLATICKTKIPINGTYYYVNGPFCPTTGGSTLYNCDGRGNLISTKACPYKCFREPNGHFDICNSPPTPTPTSVYTCKNTCTSSTLCNAEGGRVASGTCATGQVCCSFVAPTAIPTVKPPTPTPTPVYTCKNTCTSSTLCNAEGGRVASGSCAAGNVCCNFIAPTTKPTITPTPTIKPIVTTIPNNCEGVGGKCVTSCSTGNIVIASKGYCSTGQTCCSPPGDIPSPCGDFGGSCVASTSCAFGYSIAGGECSNTAQVCCDSKAMLNDLTPTPGSTSAPTPISTSAHPVIISAGHPTAPEVFARSGQNIDIYGYRKSGCSTNSDGSCKYVVSNGKSYKVWIWKWKHSTTTYRSADSCGGVYSTSRIGNFGDSSCELAKAPRVYDGQKIQTEINRQLTAIGKSSYFNLFVCIYQKESHNPNGVYAYSTSSWDAWGLFQMNPAWKSPSYPPDIGDVDWRTQIHNAIQRSIVSGHGFTYWGVYSSCKGYLP